jgi:acetyl-CoA carboxylase carboxyl transferase subunit alpha
VRLGIADQVIPEPLGGAHRDPHVVFGLVREALAGALDALDDVEPDDLVQRRYTKLRAIGVFSEDA